MNCEAEYVNPSRMINDDDQSQPSVNIEEPKPKPTPKGTKKLIFDFLNWGNIFQSFIGTAILTLPYYCYRVV